MGEVVMCSTKEGVMEAVEQMRKEESEQIMDGRTNNTSNKEGTSNSVIRWEKFLPRMVLRVLLVEADDSTRQIISALLRKCSYKVAAVDDGLKAWELLKGRPHSFDLILTEVELPSISGFALLTLIMEHNICKNTPVIMMSSHDSVGTVYKCMMRGAADFLMKPIRINELKNLWQHVWRRQSAMSNGLEPQDESVAQQQHQKLEATAENNDAAVNDHSSGSKRVALRQEDCLKKGSDDQSSCTKPDLEDESASVEKDDADRVMPREKCDRSPVTDTKAEEAALFQSSETSQNMNNQDYIVSGLDFAGSRISNEINNGDDGSHEEMRNHRNAANYIHSAEAACLKTTDSQAESSRQAIDLIGTLNNNRSNNCSSFDGLFGVGNPGVLFQTPELNLSLRRLAQDGENNNLNLWQNNNTLVRSNASAFSRYVNKQVQQPSLVVVSAFSPREGQITSTNHSSNHMSSEPAGTRTPKFTQQRLYPIPVPMKGVQKLNPDHRPYKFDQTTIKTVQIDQQRLDSLDDRVINASSATDHNGSGSLCNNGAEFITGRHLNRCGSISGSNGNNNNNNNNKSNNVGTSGGGGATFWNSGAESGNEESFMSARERSCHRSILREAALTKFRLKRKERCFEKKVRYESRKKLAEQRPRVKGQFVRQLPADPPPSLVAANPE